MWIDDQVLLESPQNISVKVWIPEKNRVVLGSANNFERECFASHCTKDGIEVLRRYGGGGTVVLHPGCLIVSFGLWVKSYFENKKYFVGINNAVIDSLSSYDSSLKDMYQDGLSDLCFAKKKVAGTSLFRSRNYLLYQASILCENDINLINRYLRHPSKEPKYRKGKDHNSFMTDLKSILGFCNLETLKQTVEETIDKFLHEHLGGDLIASQEKQVPHLLAKARAPSSKVDFISSERTV